MLCRCVKGKKDIPMSSSTDILPAKANASELLYYIQVFPHSDNHELLKYISINFLNHPLSALGKASKKMLFQAIMSEFFVCLFFRDQRFFCKQWYIRIWQIDMIHRYSVQ